MTLQAYNRPMDASAIKESLEKIEDLPVPVHSWDVMEGEDATSDAAIWVWITLDNADTSPSERAEIRRRVRDAVHASTDDSWVYVRFRDEVEEAKQA